MIKIFRNLIIFMTLLLVAAPLHALAFNSTQRFELERSFYYDPTDCVGASSNAASTAGGGTGTGKVFIIGDSISNGTSAQLTAALTEKGFSSVDIDAKDSRRLSSGGTELDGISVFEKDTARWKDASTIIIELGTNGTINPTNIAAITALIKAGNPTAKVYWVNIGVNNAQRSSPIDFASLNNILTSNAADGGYTVIDWASVVTAHPEYISDLGVHPFTEAGRPSFASTVARAIVSTAGEISTAPKQVTGGASCICENPSESGGNLSGSDNQQKAFNYFVSKGFTPQQSAGIIGNLIAESGVNPKRVQSTPTPEGDRDNITVNNKTGYGIAQWTSSGRQQGLVDLARSRGLQIEGDLALQLDFLLKEVDESYAGIRLTPDLRSSSDYFMTQFERPKDQSEAAKVKRASAGQQVLELYGGGAVPDPSKLTATEGCNSTGATGQAAGFVGFPLQTTKARMTELNGRQFNNGTMGRGGHPYAAFDIMADPDTPVVSILPGKVVSISEDKCPGRLVSIFDEAKGVTVSYLHLSISKTLVKKGDVVTAGQIIGYVGQNNEGCGSAHLHIDVAAGDSRPGCRRENCPAANQAIFEEGEAMLGLGKGLFDTYEKLP
jgi:hypothetical protein